MSNLEIKDNAVNLSINPKIYNLDVIYSAAYVFLDRAYILLNGDPEKEIIVTLKAKEGEDLEKLGLDFNNELLNYSHYKSKVKDLGEIRRAIMQRALLIYETPKPVEANDDILDDVDLDIDELDEEIDDPEGIAIPWEEKYGDKSPKK